MNNRDRWQQAMNNLMARRSRGTQGDSVEANIIRDYRSHLSKVSIGESVLDIGCGDMGIEKILRSGHFKLMGKAGNGPKYTGIDAFPISDAVIKMEVEQMDFPDDWYDTIICFAVLDGVCDLEKALAQMARVCKCNIVFLTGIGIEPDQYHTYKITEKILSDNLPGFKRGYSQYFTPNVALIEFIKG